MKAIRHPIGFIKTLVADYKAWRQGLKRVAPRFAANGLPVMRGRTHAKIRLDAVVTRKDGSKEHYVIDSKGQRRIS